MKNSSHFVSQETVLSSTSIRHLPLKEMGFADSPTRLQISHTKFLDILARLRIQIQTQSKKTTFNARKRLGKNTVLGNIIYEILMSHEYRKSPKIYTSKTDFLYKINQSINANKPIELIIPLFPCKVHNRLKSLGIYPDFAEILSLLRLLEICLAIENIYQPGAFFIIMADGYRFQKPWNTPCEDIVEYQKKMVEFIKLINAEKYLKLFDYVETLEKKLPIDRKIKRGEDLLSAQKEYHIIKEAMEKVSSNDYLKRLEVAMKLDPDFDSGNSEGRFVPLFKSTIYSIYFPELTNKKTDNQIKTLFEDIYTFEDLEYGKTRKFILDMTLDSTIKYIVSVRSDRDIDPLRIIFPEALRCTIHSKPGQLGITTINKSTRIESWHGTGYIASNGKIGVDFRISLESEGFLPVYVEGDPFNMGDQPIFYSNEGAR